MACNVDNVNKTPIINGLLKYINEDVTSFYMPGHKKNERNFNELNLIQDNLFKMDNTEVPGLDNLHIPEEMILMAENKAALAYGAGKSYFLVNGSTSGIYAMILGCTKPGDKIIVQRNCHRSVYSACLLGELKTAYIAPLVHPDFKCAVSIDVNEAVKVMDENPDAKALVLTYPTYFGTCCDMKKIAFEAKKRGMLVLVDEAHGAHFPFNKRLPKTALSLGADISVVSLHKTTPAMTQTALLNIREGLKIEGISFMASVFQSTSPSYILMAAIDAALSIMEDKGEKLLDEIIDNSLILREKMNNVSEYEFLGNDTESVGLIHDLDLTRIVIKSPYGGRKLDEILRRDFKIQVEMSDIYNIVLITTVGNTKNDFEKLYNALKAISKSETPEALPGDNIVYPLYKQALTLREAYYKEKKRIKLSEAEGCISGEMAAPYPPGIPVVLPGEIITYEVIQTLKSAVKSGIPLNGIADSKGEYIYIVK